MIRRLCELLDADVSDDNVSDSKRIKCEIDVHLMREEVERLIQRQGEAGSDEKIAFKFRGDSKPVWADQKDCRPFHRCGWSAGHHGKKTAQRH